MSKTKKSKLLASMLCATVVAGLYAGPVMAAQSGLTVGSGSSAQSVTAANFVTINGVTLSGNKVTATSLQLGSTALTETNLKNVNNIFSGATGAKPTIYVGGINVKDDAGAINFSVSKTGAVTAKNNITTQGGAIYVKDTAGKTNFSVSNAGAVTANGGITSNKTTVTGTEFNGTDNFNSAKNTLESAGFATTKMVGNSTLGYTDGKYTTIDGQKIDIFNGGVANVGGNSNYDTAATQNQKYTTSKGTVTSIESGLYVSTSQKTEEVKVTETFEKESVEAEYSNPQANGATMGNVNINKDGGTTTYKVTHTTTDITNNFSNTSAGGLTFKKTSSQKKEEFVQTADTSHGTVGELNGTTSYTQTDTTNNMSQNNGAFSMSGTVQNNAFANQADFESGKFESGTKTSNSIAGSNGSVSMSASKDYIDYTDGIAEGDVGYNQAANKTTVNSSIKVNSASGTSADDASGSITLSNSKVNYEYGPYDKFGKPSTTTAVNEYSTTATVGKGDFSVSGNRYGKDEGNKGKVVGAGSMYVNSESYGTRLSQSNYEYDEAGNQIIKSATISLNNGAVAISGSESASLKAGNYGFATTKDGINTITGKNFAVAANGTLTLNNGTNNTLYVDASGNLTNTAKTNYADGREYGSTLTNSATSGLTSNVTYTDADDNVYSSKVTNTATGGLTTTVTGNGNTVTSKTSNTGITDSFTDANGTHSVTTNGNGTTFSATGSGTGSTIINGSTITTGTIKAGNTTINSSGLTVGSTTISSGTITTGTLNVDTINLGSKIVDKDGNPVYDLTINANGSANFAQGNFKIDTDGALTNTVAYSNASGDYTGNFKTDYSSNTLSNKLDKGEGVSQETALTTGYGSGSLIHKENGVQTAGLTVAATGATLAGNTSTYVKANNDGTITVNGTNFAVAANGTLTLKNGTNDTFKVDTSGNLTNTAKTNYADGREYGSTLTNSATSGLTSNVTYTDADDNVYSSKVTNTATGGLTTTVTGNGNTVTSKTSNTGITDSFTADGVTHSVTTNGYGTTFSATGMGSTVINGGTIKTGSTTINGTGMAVGSTSISSGNIKVGNTQITGNSITTDTLNVNTIKLGSQIVDNDGNRLVGIEISANGNLTSSVVNGDYSSKLTNQYNGLTSTVAYKDADNNEYTSTFTNKYNGTTTTVKGKGNTVTSKTTADSIEDIFVNADGTHKVTTNGLGTSFYASGIGTTTINGNKITTKYINDVDFSKWYKDVNANLDELNDKTQNINTNNTYGKGEQPAGGSSTVQPGGNTDFTGNLEADSITAGSATIGGVQIGGSVTVGDTVVSDGKVSVGGENGTNITEDKITVGAGVTEGEDGKYTGSQVTVGDGDVKVEWTEDGEKQSASIQGNAQKIEDLGNTVTSEVSRLDSRIDKVEDRIDKVGAMSAAIANLRTMGYDPTAPTEIAVGIGQYRSETGAALGLFHYPNRDFMLSLSVSTSGDEVMGGIGATWKFGRKTPEQMLAAEKEKAAKAKLAKAEAMKKAAAEAKVAEQQAKHAKMAAEKAAK